MFQKCRITVIKKDCNMELVNSYVIQPENFSICNRVEENQVFIITNPYEMPEGICAWAWADIRPQILAMASGSTFEFLKDKNSTIASCSDHFRPVTFKIERMGD
jgi:uncharacterized repeat protein (TIGR04076 family)